MTLPFYVEKSIINMADVDDFDETRFRSHDMFCFDDNEEDVIVCPNCLLTYHNTCVRWNDDCGCTKIREIKLRYSIVNNHAIDII